MAADPGTGVTAGEMPRAGHDAGVVGERVPAAMVFVRNPTGVSHAPDEVIDLEDAAVAARVAAHTLEEMA